MAAAVLTLLSLIYLGGLAALLCVAYSRRHFNRYTAVKAACKLRVPCHSRHGVPAGRTHGRCVFPGASALLCAVPGRRRAAGAGQ